MRKTASLGYYGNIWIRQNVLEKAGEYYQGHTHDFDHVTLLCTGTVRIEIQGRPAKDFTGPTFIIIKRDLEHKFTAITDNCVWFCIHALRDIDGQVIEDIYSMENDPSEYLWSKLPDEQISKLVRRNMDETEEQYQKRLADLEQKTTRVKQNAEVWNAAREQELTQKLGG